MKITHHDRRPQIDRVRLDARKLIVWLDPRTALEIEPGDQLRDVAREVSARWNLAAKDARTLVATWFSLAEHAMRRAGGPGPKLPGSTKLSRRYDPRR